MREPEPMRSTRAGATGLSRDAAPAGSGIDSG